MRIGQNPAKSVKEVPQPARITVAVLNYIPFKSGFYAELDQVLKACIDSIRSSISDIDYDLLVFDNGSTREIQEYLLDEQEKGNIQFLILSDKNLGKGGAWNIMLEAAPGEIIAFTDNDCLFSDGWLAESIKILETYPNVGMVTARPFRTNPDLFTGTLEWAKNNPDVELKSGQIIPYDVFREFDMSLGQSQEEIQAHYDSSEDHMLEYKGVKAMAGASHWQFTAYKKTIKEFLPFSMDRPMGQVKQLDMRMNEKGYLRLMTTKPLAMNMSNTLINAAGEGMEKTPELKSDRLVDKSFIKNPLMGIYNRIFHLYYDTRTGK